MRTCSPEDFVARWPGMLQPVTLESVTVELSADTQALLVKFGLPREFIIYCYNNTTIRFSGRATPLAAIWERDLKQGYKLGSMPLDWDRYWHLADQEYTQGGGWICLEERTERLVVIDLDLREPIYLLNASVRSFYTTLAHLLEWSERSGGTPAETTRLRDELRGQACIPPDELEPFWLNSIDATLDYVDEGIVWLVSLDVTTQDQGD